MNVSNLARRTAGLAVAAILLAAGSAMAGAYERQAKVYTDLQTFEQGIVVAHTLNASGTLNVSGALQIGAVAVTATAAELNAAADNSVRLAATLAATNGQALVLSAATPVQLVKGAGSAAGSTNACTIYPVFVPGQLYHLVGAPGQSNVVSIANSATVRMGADVYLSTNDTLSLLGVATNLAVKIGSASN